MSFGIFSSSKKPKKGKRTSTTGKTVSRADVIAKSKSRKPKKSQKLKRGAAPIGPRSANESRALAFKRGAAKLI